MGQNSMQIWGVSGSIFSANQQLADSAAGIWTAPELPEDILLAYKPVPPEGTSYTISDHPHLQGGLARELFESVRVHIQALDECVSEEFLKLYVAYKAETNFVDVVPQASGLRLSLNLNFPEIDDPKRLCRDVTNLGRWGNGNVEVRLEKQEDLTYVIGLVRQALEKQLGEEEDD